MRKKFRVLTVFCVLTAVALWSFSSGSKESEEAKVTYSKETEECVECHQEITPGIVSDWLSSEHAHETPGEAQKKPALELEVSSKDIPESLKNVPVGCYECHSRNTEKHQDSFDHFGYTINIVVSPEDCKTCHSAEVEEYTRSKKANALHNIQKNPVYHQLVETITSLKEIQNGEVVATESSAFAKAESCYACHGTKVEVKGKKVLETEVGDIEVPELSNWPNQGVGRINPDASLGSCTACHPRHSFSIEIARRPYTCSQCHLEPDVPAWNVYRESKHGNIFQSQGQDWNWGNVPWVIGRDVTAPTCSTCHNSLITKPNGEVLAQRTHDFGSRLWVRLFGLIYSHPQPKDGRTYLIKNEQGLPLPTTLNGEIAADYLISPGEQKDRQEDMEAICQSCHGMVWTQNHFVKLEATIKEADRMVSSATQILEKAWEKGIMDNANLFDEALEMKWIKQWLYYANSLRYASAMIGSDYAAFKNGWFELTKNLREMSDSVKARSDE